MEDSRPFHFGHKADTVKVTEYVQSKGRSLC